MHLATGVVRGLPAHQPLLGGASCARVAPPRAQFEEDEEYLADLEQEVRHAQALSRSPLLTPRWPPCCS